GEPESYQKDFFDPIKNIHLGDDWRLTLGGEVRFRMEAETNKAFGATEPAQDTFTLYRYLVHADLRYHKLFRVFVQGAAMFDEDRDLALRPIDENRWDLHQLFFDVRFLGEDKPLTLRVGRQELSYGNQRLVSPFEWGNIRRRFDGVKAFARTEKWDIDAWYVKPVIVQRKQSDRLDEDVDFYGLYMTYKGIPRHGVDVYVLAIDDTGNSRNPNGKTGDRNQYTMGSRFWGKTAAFDYEAELAGQWGHWAGDTVQAWSWTLDGGYTLEPVAWKPRIGAGFDWASGDEKPRDGKVGTFDQLFPLAHKYFGFLDLIGRQNVTAVNMNLSAWPVEKKVQTALAYHAFWLNDDRDALYGASGAPGRRDPTGHSGTEIGHELDVTVMWKVDVHSSLLFGYSHFWDSDFIIETGPSEDADLFYVQYALKF
ncbi:MAG: alginate export family protein, partial [Planctomycetota bacterium]